MLEPRTANVTIRASAPVTVRLGGTPGTTVSKTFVRGATTTASTTTPQRASGQDYRFMGWTDGGDALSRTFKALTDTTLTARFLSMPGPRTRPTITGVARTRHKLAATPGGWRGNELSYAYQWLRCGASCVPIDGATGSTYRVRNADVGKRLAVRVSARNQLGSAIQESRETDKAIEGVPPSLKLSGAKGVKLGSGRLKLTVRCPSERCTLRAGGRLKIKGKKASKTRTVKKTLRAGKKATLTIRLSKQQLGAARRALRTGKSVKVQWTVTASDAASNRRTRHFTVKLRR